MLAGGSSNPKGSVFDSLRVHFCQVDVAFAIERYVRDAEFDHGGLDSQDRVKDLECRESYWSENAGAASTPRFKIALASGCWSRLQTPRADL